jgi:hypothetical protein
MDKFVKKACEEIDAAIFSSGVFLDIDNALEMKRLLERWTRNIDETIADIENGIYGHNEDE